MKYIDPYHKIGLRRNPFIAPESLIIPPQRWLDFGFSSPPSPQQKLFVQIMGEKGAGKTSHLFHWQQQTGGIYYYCELGWRRWQLPPLGEMVYWDEANRIPLILFLIRLCQVRFLNQTVVVGTHQDLSHLANLLGFKIKTIQLSTLTVEHLLQWVQKSLAAEQLSPEIPIMINLTSSQAQEIIAKSHGSWRMVANYLHIWLAQKTKEVERHK